jgi:ATP/ADP translocase
MSQTANPLDQLKDIHLPEAVSTSELAIGWILLIIIVSLIVIYWIYRYLNKTPMKQKSINLLSPAKQELEKLASLTPDHQAVAQLSALLKRICLVSFPKDKTASLSGNAWVDFLNQQMSDTNASSKGFSEEARRIFCEQAYRPNISLDKNTWLEMISTSQSVIESIINNPKGKS